jgi:hypothetical protein
MQPLYTLASQDLAAAMWPVRNDPSAGFMTLHYNQLIGATCSDREYGRALQRQCDARGNRMYRQFETAPKATTAAAPIALVKVSRGKKLPPVMALELCGSSRIILDMTLLPSTLKGLLPANWPKAEPIEFLPFVSLCLEAELADMLTAIGLLEVL